MLTTELTKYRYCNVTYGNEKLYVLVVRCLNRCLKLYVDQ